MIDTQQLNSPGGRPSSVAAAANGAVALAFGAYLGPLTIATLFAIAYYPTLVKLVAYWIANDTYSFGFFIPLLSFLMIWAKRDELGQTSASGGLVIGAAVTLSGLGLLLGGRLSSTNVVEELSLVLTLGGLTLLVFGQKIFSVLLFPLAYLVAMVPVWDVFLARLHPYFQLYSASVGVRVLRLLGVPVFRENTFLYLPNVRLEVAEACSGINYLIAIVCIGVAVGYMVIRSWPKRLLVVAAAAVIALLSNALRVAMVAAFAYYGFRGDDGDVHGPLAFARTLLVSGVGYVALFALTARFADRRTSSAPRAEPRVAPAANRAKFRFAPALVAITLLGTFLVFGRIWQVNDAPLGVSLSAAIPERIGTWESRPWSSVGTDVPPLEFDDRLQRYYATPQGDELALFVGYINRQIQGRELAGYDMHRALDAGRPRSIVLVDGTEVQDVLIREGAATYHLIYWYVVDNHAFARDVEAKAYSAWRAVVHRRNSGGLVIIRTRADVDASGKPLADLRDFVAQMVSLSTRISPPMRM